MRTTLNKIREPVLCKCGCGEAAPEIKRNNSQLGHMAGQHHDFVAGHNKRVVDSLGLLMARVEKTEECWIWVGRLNRKGYGNVQVKGVKRNAHRAVYLESGFVIPDGYHLDHLCRNKTCVNPAHMEPVTPQENVRRQHAARKAAMENAK